MFSESTDRGKNHIRGLQCHVLNRAYHRDMWEGRREEKEEENMPPPRRLRGILRGESSFSVALHCEVQMINHLIIYSE